MTHSGQMHLRRRARSQTWL